MLQAAARARRGCQFRRERLAISIFHASLGKNARLAREGSGLGRLNPDDNCAPTDRLCAFVLGVRHGRVSSPRAWRAFTYSNVLPYQGSACR